MREEDIDARDGDEGYKPPLEFEEDGKKSLFDLTSSDSQEFWLIQWPANQPPDFDGQEVSLNLHHDGKLGSLEGSSGKVYDVVSFGVQEPDVTVFLSFSQESKIGKVSRRVSLVHYPDPKELEKANSGNMNQMHQKSSVFSFTTSSHQFTTPTQSSGKRRLDSVSGRTTSTCSSKQKSSLSEIGKRSNPAVSVNQSSKKRKNAPLGQPINSKLSEAAWQSLCADPRSNPSMAKLKVFGEIVG